MTRGEVWLAEVGRKRRPVLVLTRPEVLDVRVLVTVAEISTAIRGIGAEAEFDHARVGLEKPSVINCDGLHTITQASLTHMLGEVSEREMQRVCAAVNYALGC
ncbi:MAG: type II toxin-antitoxin system PemK/MazF family toxin [Candidatus Dormibacterales bacterium]